MMKQIGIFLAVSWCYCLFKPKFLLYLGVNMRGDVFLYAAQTEPYFAEGNTELLPSDRKFR